MAESQGPTPPHRELSEDEVPMAPVPSTELLSEDEDIPGASQLSQLSFKKWEHAARQQDGLHKTRTWLAKSFFWLVAVMTMLPISALVFGNWTHFNVDQFKELGLFFTPIVTLASAAFGFFFATDDRKSREP